MFVKEGLLDVGLGKMSQFHKRQSHFSVVAGGWFYKCQIIEKLSESE